MEDSELDTNILLPNNNATKQNGSKLTLYIYSVVMLLGAVSTGLMLGLSSPIIPAIRDDKTSNAIPIGDNEASWIGSILTLGGMVGGFIAGITMQKFGRKFTAIFSGAPYVAGLLMISYASNVEMIYAGRFTTGLGLAFTSLVVPTYISEIAPQNMRGLLCSGNQLFITIGVFIVYAIGHSFTWRWLVLVCATVPVMYSIFCLFIPETPRYLYLQNRAGEAKKALQSLRGKYADINGEVEELQTILESNSVEATWKELFSNPSIRTPFLISVFAMFFQQFSGINAVMFYAQTIFEDAGFKTQSQLYLSLLLISGIQVFFTVISSLLSDRTGRKVLLGVSTGFMAISMGTFGLYFQLISNDPEKVGSLSWLALSSLIVYIATFSLGLGPIPWVIMSELIPMRARGKCSGLITAFNLLFAFVVTKEFNDLQNAITPQGAYWVFAGICVLAFFYSIFILPETKGQTLEEIEAYFNRSNNTTI